MAKNNEMNLIEGNLFKKIVIYAMPIILSGILQLLYTAADLIVCGQFGSKDSTAAITSTNSLVHLITNLFLGLSVGANVLMARCYGKNDKDKAQRVVYTAMIFAISVGIILAIFGFFMSRIFLEMMGTTSDVIELSSVYLKIFFLGLPFSMIYNFGASILRAVGDTKRPFYYLTFSGVFNVLLNLFFVIVLNLDVKGVALATIISQGISALLILRCLFKYNGFFEFKLSKIRFYLAEALEIARIGMPAGLQGMIFSFSNVLIQSSVNSLGTQVVGGNGAAGSLEGFIYVSMNSVAQSCVAFVSANYGAGRKENIKTVVKYSTVLVIIMNMLVGSIILLFHKPLLGLYVHTDEAILAGTQRIFIIALTYFLCGLMDTYAYSLRGIGYSVIPMIISLCGACGLRLLWIFFIFPIDAFHSISGLAVSYPISWLITALTQLTIFIILFKKLKIEPKVINREIKFEI